jgi:plastocyanin
MAGRRTPAESLSGSACAVLLLISACAPIAPGAATPSANGVRPSSPVRPNAQATPSDEKSSLVLAADRFFVPAAIEVKVGATVTWRNEGQEVHNIVAHDGSFRSPDLAPDNTYSYNFLRPGRFSYLCTYHAGDGMYGEVDVR